MTARQRARLSTGCESCRRPGWSIVAISEIGGVRPGLRLPADRPAPTLPRAFAVSNYRDRLGACMHRCPLSCGAGSSGLVGFAKGLAGRRLRIRSPKPSAGNFHHLDVVRLKAIIDSPDGAHARRCHGLFAAKRVGTYDGADHQRPYWMYRYHEDRPKPQGQDYRRPFEGAQYLAACLTGAAPL